MFDVIVIGGGVVGGLILRELTKYRLSVCLLEKENDVCMGASKANSGIVHAGYDAQPGTLKAKFNVLGNKMMPTLCQQLGVKYVGNGSLVVAFNQEDRKTLISLQERGGKNGVKGLKIIEGKELQTIEPNLSTEGLAALYAPTAGVVCPYTLTIAAIGNAMDNGAKLRLNFQVTGIQKEEDYFCVSDDNGQAVKGKIVVNCAGYYGGEIARLVGDDYIHIGGRKGEYILLDRECGGFVSHTLFFTPSKTSKGILLTRTVDGNILMGPTAEEVDDCDKSTSEQGIAFIKEKAQKMCKKPPFSHTITSFAGVRAFSDKHDFIIEESQAQRGIIHCVGIESPGLTASPAIAQYVVNTLIAGILPLQPNEQFDGNRAPDYFFKDLSVEEQNKLIKRNPAYGKIVCRCEGITEGEIVRAIQENPPATDVDGIKRRTRSGMGRCQGGFCQPQIVELLAKEQGIPCEKVTKSGGESFLLQGVTK